MGFSRVKIYEDDNKWAWKFVLRILAILLNITGIALTAWALSKASFSGGYEDGSSYYYGNDNVFLPWNLITFSLSFIWCSTNICILISRSYPIHPGANVGCDLILWLSFIVTGFFSTIGAINTLYTGDYPSDANSNYNSYDNGDYASYPNGTSYIISPDHPAPPCPGFDSCAQEDVIKARMKARGTVVMAATAIAFLMVLVHFALFISACRFTSQRRHQKVTKEATVIAREIIHQMTQEGRLQPMQQPLLATEEGTRGHSTSNPTHSSAAPEQQPQPIPHIMVHGANQDDGISHVPAGQAV